MNLRCSGSARPLVSCAIVLVLNAGTSQAQTTHTISNGDVTVGINLEWGASITRLDYRVGSLIAINNVDNSGGPGRQIEAAIYDAESLSPDCWPVIGSGGSCQPNPSCLWKWNPVQAGTACGTGSPASVLLQTGTRIVTRTYPAQWNPFWGPSNVVIDQDLEILSSNLVRVIYTITNNEAFVVNGGHELPVVYLQNQYNVAVHYAGSAPGTNDPLVTERTFANGNKANSTTTTEPWAGFAQKPPSPPHSETCELSNCPAVLLHVPEMLSNWNLGRMEDGVSLLQAWQDATFEPGETRTLIAYLAVGTFAAARTAIHAVSDDELFADIVPGGPPVSLTFTKPGQRAWLYFYGVAGQRVSAYGLATNRIPSNANLFSPLTIVRLSTGTDFGDEFGFANKAIFGSVELPATEQYAVLVDPFSDGMGTVTITLYDSPDVAGSISVDGSSVAVPFSIPGQRGLLTFAAAAGQRVSILGSSANVEGTFPGSSLWNPVAIWRPDGTVLWSEPDGSGGAFFEPVLIPATGIYTLLIDPYADSTGTATMNLYEVDDVTGSIAIDGPPVAVPLDSPGESARLVFSASGQRVSVVGVSSGVVSNGTPGASLWMPLAIVDSSTVLGSVTDSSSTTMVEPVALGTGTYTVLVDPLQSTTGTATVRLHHVIDVAGSISLNAEAVAVPLSTPGQIASLSLTIAATQQVTVRLTGNTIGQVVVRLLRSDGSQVATKTSLSSNFNMTPQTLTTGTYTVVVDPYKANSGVINAQATNP